MQTAKVVAEVYERLGQPKTIRLTADIRILEGWLKLRIDGGDEITLKALPIVKLSGDTWQLATTGLQGSTGVVLSWPWGVGTHGFSIEPRQIKRWFPLFTMVIIMAIPMYRARIRRMPVRAT